MTVDLEQFSLQHIITQFYEFNSAVRDNYAQLAPYFWWTHANIVARFKLILSGIIAEKMSHILYDLPYNKRFIIRADGKFAGACGLDGIYKNAPRAEIWMFLTNDFQGCGIASNAIRQIEEYARQKYVNQIYAKTKLDNKASQNMLRHNKYNTIGDTLDCYGNPTKIIWYKSLHNKNY